MDDLSTRKISTSMRNAITTNNYHGHALGKTFKQLEIEKDLKMLSLQMKKDEVRFSSPSSPRTIKKSPPLTVEDNEELIELTTENLKTDCSSRKLSNTRQLLPLIRSNSAKTRRVGMMDFHASSSQSSPPSPKAAHTKLFSSTSVELDVNREIHKPLTSNKDEVHRVGSPRISRSSTASPILTAKLPKTDAPPSSPTTVHRGLAIRPLSWKSATSQKVPQSVEKPKTVFSRLYQVQPPKTKKSIAELMGDPPASPRLRRRSISTPDLSEAMEDFRQCRYLRQNSNDEK